MYEPYDFGHLLRQLREEKNLKQAQLADKLGISTTAISKYEHNTAMPPFDTMRALSVIFNVSMDTLYGTEPRGTISTHGLTENQITIIQTLSRLFQNTNFNVQKTLTPEQATLLGQIVSEFLK